MANLKLFVSAIICALLVLCFVWQVNSKPPILRVYMGVDISGSAVALQPAALQAIGEINDALSPSRDVEIVYAYGHNCQEIYHGPPMRETSAFLSVIRQGLTMPSSNGTRPGVALETICADISHNKGEARCIALLYADLDVDDTSAAEATRLRKAAQSLTSESQFAGLLILGCPPSNRSLARATLGSLGENRFTIGEASEQHSVQRWIRNARRMKQQD